MKQRIVRFRQDEQGHWIAELECGHTQHVRHDPPWMNRPWVTTEEGRAGFLRHELHCAECVAALAEPSVSLAQKLADFDPKLHGCEVMATAPAGNEKL